MLTLLILERVRVVKVLYRLTSKVSWTSVWVVVGRFYAVGIHTPLFF